MKGKTSLAVIFSIFLVLLMTLMFIGACAETAPTPATPAPATPAPAAPAAPAPAAPTPAAPTPATPAEPVKPIELVYSQFQPSISLQTEACRRWYEKIEEETGGRVKFVYYPDSTLVSMLEQYDACVAGVCDLAHSGRYKEKGNEFGSRCQGFAYGISDLRLNQDLSRLMFEKFARYRDNWAGSKVIFNAGCSPCRIFTNFPVNTLADLKGRIIRSPGLEGNRILQELEASPVAMPPSDVYMALQKGTVQGIVTTYDFIHAFKVNDVLTHYVDNTIFYSPFTGHSTCMNWDTWNSLPEDIQDIIEQSRGWVENELNNAWIEADGMGIALAKESGGTFVTLTPEELTTFYAECHEAALTSVKELNDMGLPGDEAYKTVEEWKEANVPGYKSPLFK